MNPKVQYALVIILILIVTGALTYLKVVPQELFISVFTLCIGNLSGVPVNLSRPTPVVVQGTSEAGSPSNAEGKAAEAAQS